MVDARDLKSLGGFLCAGSSPAPGILFVLNSPGMKHRPYLNFTSARLYGKKAAFLPFESEPNYEYRQTGQISFQVEKIDFAVTDANDFKICWDVGALAAYHIYPFTVDLITHISFCIHFLISSGEGMRPDALIFPLMTNPGVAKILYSEIFLMSVTF